MSKFLHPQIYAMTISEPRFSTYGAIILITTNLHLIEDIRLHKNANLCSYCHVNSLLVHLTLFDKDLVLIQQALGHEIISQLYCNWMEIMA
jgi:hypothetical protein